MTNEEDASMVSLAWVLLRRTAAVAAVYAVGYLGFSPAWVIGGIILSVMREKWRREKQNQRNISRAISLNSEQVTLAKLQDLPSWVHFPDVERAEWLNKMLKQLWPYVGDYVKNMLKTDWEGFLATTMATYKLYNFKFDQIMLGDIAPRVGGVKVYSDNIQRSEIVMDVEIFYAGDCRIECSFSRMSAGIRDLQLHGVLRIVYKPLITTIPLVGGMQVFFLNNPDIEFDMLGVAEVLDMPGLSGILRNVILETIATMMVLPNKLPIVLSDQIPTKLVTASQPKGVLRVRLIEAKDLMRKDRNLFGQGKSDPYALIYIGAKQFKTKYIQDTVDPVWNYVCEFMVVDPETHWLRLDLYDADDPGNKDDKLGRCALDVGEIAKAGSQDIWVPLEQARTGRIHLKLDWLGLSTNVADIKKQLNEIEDLSAYDNSGLHSAIVTVFVDSAAKLPMASRAAAEPNPEVHLAVGSVKQQTTCKYRTLDPVWEEGFSFLVSNPLTQSLSLEVEDEKTEKRLGHLQLDIKDLLKERNLEVTEQSYQLKDSGPVSKIVLTMQLRLLTHDRVPAEDISARRPSAVPGRPVVPPSPVPDAHQPVVDEAAVADAAVTRVEGTEELEPPVIPAVPAVQVTEEPSPEPLPAETREQVEELIQNLASPSDQSADSPSDLRRRKPEHPGGQYRLGRIYLTVRYSDTRAALVVTIHKVASLPMEGDDIPDPYVKTYLLPDKVEEHKRKTKMIKDNCDPVYDEALEYKGQLREMKARMLEVQVVSKKIFGRNPVLGIIHLELDALDLTAGVTDWYDLEPEDRYHSHKKGLLLTLATPLLRRRRRSGGGGGGGSRSATPSPLHSPDLSSNSSATLGHRRKK